MDPFYKQNLNDNHCFLCGEELTPSTRSDEHVFPEWLQREFDLWNQKIQLLNETLIPYRQILIPCCKNCNNGCLSQMENDLSSMLNGNFKEPTKEEELKLFRWCSKIFYGILHKEMVLLSERAKIDSGPIIEKEFLEQIKIFHYFMTSIKRRFNFVDFKPYSLFVMETLTYDESVANFDYFDFIVFGDFQIQRLNLVLCIRVKQFGIICIFQDNGFQKLHFQDLFDEYKGIPLHPIQFLEYSCKAAYKNSLIRFSPLCHSITDEYPWSDITVMPANYPQGEIWDTWDNRAYAAHFCSMAEAHCFTVPSYENFVVGNKVVTYLDDGLGNPVKMTKNHVPGVKE